MINVIYNRMTSQTEECGASYGNVPYSQKEICFSIDSQDLVQIISFTTFCLLQLKALLLFML